MVEEYTAQLTVIIPEKKRYVNLIGTFSQDNLALFLDKVMKGKVQTSPFHSFPIQL